jgi:hypothetical protein
VDEIAFPWPPAERLVNDFIKRADLVESGQYMKLVLPGEKPRNLVVWIDDAEIERSGMRLRQEATEFYAGRSEAEAVLAALAVDLFETLDSLPAATTELVFRKGSFYAVE